MRKTRSILPPAVAVVCLLGFLSPEVYSETEPQPAPDVAQLAAGNNEFACDLYGKLRGAEAGNVFVSPLSVSSALAMTYAGARGETEKQMAQVMHFALDQGRLHPAMSKLVDDLLAADAGNKRPYELSIANALWGQKGYGFLKEFIDLTHQWYKAGFSELDFRADAEAGRKTINAWVEKETREKIKELIKQGILDRDTRLVLTNAIYFNGAWTSQFAKENTRYGDFTLADGAKAKVPMMNQTHRFKYGESGGLKMLEMPYQPGRLSMVVLLPAAANGLPELEPKLTAKQLAQWVANMNQAEVSVSLPRFKMTRECELSGVLQSLGMNNAFSEGPADFSGMNGKKDLFISKVIHKAYVDVNEKGTEAAAATAVVMREGMEAPARPEEFRADHPFIFLIRDNRAGSILFMGRVADPR